MAFDFLDKARQRLQEGVVDVKSSLQRSFDELGAKPTGGAKPASVPTVMVPSSVPVRGVGPVVAVSTIGDSAPVVPPPIIISAADAASELPDSPSMFSTLADNIGSLVKGQTDKVCFSSHNHLYLLIPLSINHLFPLLLRLPLPLCGSLTHVFFFFHFLIVFLSHHQKTPAVTRAQFLKFKDELRARYRQRMRHMEEAVKKRVWIKIEQKLDMMLETKLRPMIANKVLDPAMPAELYDRFEALLDALWLDLREVSGMYHHCWCMRVVKRTCI
jgi:hypothetical protein